MSRRNFWLVLGILTAVLTLVVASGSSNGFAADDAAAAPAAAPAAADAAASAPKTADPAKAKTSSVPETPIDMIIASGTIGWMICLLSVVTLALVIEAFMYLKREKLLPEDLLNDITAALDNGNYEEAVEICQADDCMMTRIIGAGLAKMPNGFDRMEEAIAEESDVQVTLLHQKIGYISLIAGVAPSLGLLGTVQGMVMSFGMIATNPQTTSADLAGGIYVALMTTLEGLVVSIPATVAFVFLRNKITKLTFLTSVINNEILDRFRGGEAEAEE